MKLMRSRNKRGLLNEFSLEFCTYNRASGKGGERITVNRAILYEKGKAKKKALPVSDAKTKNPNHELNGTRNILLLPSREIRSIHVRLIERFNNKIVFD
ncbi:MAG: hypothetical protein PF590_01265 [Candidatus Delongbacteria bacterium]|jgi:hypothetical protein|nr:hypothetical protein [Candidatus Delongbacteria bacterium]